jgi:hypothetical protein
MIRPPLLALGCGGPVRLRVGVPALDVAMADLLARPPKLQRKRPPGCGGLVRRNFIRSEPR